MNLVLKTVLKTTVRGICLMAAFPCAAASAFGRWEPVYTLFAQGYAMAPGIVGDYLRIAYYKLTLAECSLSSRISFGSFFAHPEARLGAGAYIGSYCIIGRAAIGERTQIASGVQILSGSRQHVRNEDGEISGAEQGIFTTVGIGAHCWIGAAAVVMADVGEGATVGAGAVITRPIPAHSVAAGNPARVIRSFVADS
jgi:acetyltransferase-like isoleucine patch superfamily enzyme